MLETGDVSLDDCLPSCCIRDPQNYEEDIRDLSRDIAKEPGNFNKWNVQSPIIAYKSEGKYIVIDGQLRFEALKMWNQTVEVEDRIQNVHIEYILETEPKDWEKLHLAALTSIFSPASKKKDLKFSDQLLGIYHILTSELGLFYADCTISETEYNTIINPEKTQRCLCKLFHLENIPLKFSEIYFFNSADVETLASCKWLGPNEALWNKIFAAYKKAPPQSTVMS